MAHFELMEKMAPNAIIKVVGVGGGGGNAVAHMVSNSVDGVEFITANTDHLDDRVGCHLFHQFEVRHCRVLRLLYVLLRTRPGTTLSIG